MDAGIDKNYLRCIIYYNKYKEGIFIKVQVINNKQKIDTEIRTFQDLFKNKINIYILLYLARTEYIVKYKNIFLFLDKNKFKKIKIMTSLNLLIRMKLIEKSKEDEYEITESGIYTASLLTTISYKR